MHLLKGVYVTLPERVVLLTDVYKDEYISRVKAFIKMCEDRIAGRKMKISIENVDTNLFTSSQIDALEFFMKSDVFGLTLDVGHDDCMSGKDAHVFEKYPERLCHLHLHDSDGKHAHLALGDGRVNIREKLSLLKGDSTCLVEVKTIAGLEKSVNYLRTNNFLR
jgi:sugar phosphate isomerase/epimerase